eukprot:m.6664 g.6664  ORF g.6664 m.6664 type:complete len:132 (+) comp5181_c0_seq1:264-659(+)
MERRLVSKEDESDALILREDQDMINEFARQNVRLHDLKQQLKMLQHDAEGLEDASNEVLLSDEDQVKMKIGDCFFSMVQDDAETVVSGLQEINEQDVDALNGKIEAVEKRLAELKATLYGKFGKSINLEDD